MCLPCGRTFRHFCHHNSTFPLGYGPARAGARPASGLPAAGHTALSCGFHNGHGFRACRTHGLAARLAGGARARYSARHRAAQRLDARPSVWRGHRCQRAASAGGGRGDARRLRGSAGPDRRRPVASGRRCRRGGDGDRCQLRHRAAARLAAPDDNADCLRQFHLRQFRHRRSGAGDRRIGRGCGGLHRLHRRAWG